MKTVPFIISPRKNPNWRAVVDRCCAEIRAAATAGQDVMVKVSDAIRSLDQNSKMWPMLTDIAEQVQWPVNGVLQLIEPEDWKAILTAAFQREARMAPGLRGGFVMLGARTSRFSKREMSDFIEFMYAEGADRGVLWSERSKEHFADYGLQRSRAA